MDNVTKAYIAGFFDGEGSVGFVWRKSTKNKKKYGRLLARLTQNDRSILEWIRRKTGFGSIHQTKKKNPRWKLTHYYVVAYEAARQFLWAIQPFLKVKAKAVKDNLRLDAKYCKRRRA